VTGRSRSEFNSIFGHFVNMLPMRSTIKGAGSFTELLTQVQQTVLEALDHQDFPFALMVERLHPQRDSSYSPIIQTNFMLQSFEQAYLLASGQDETSFSWGDLKFIPYNPVLFEGQSDLDLEMSEINSKLTGAFKYNTDLFEQSTIERMLSHFQALLEGIVADPQQPVSRLPLLTVAERQQLLVDWNDTAVGYPDDKCIHQLFEEQVDKTPDAVAVVFEQQKLTYSQLNSKANQLAHYLQGLGVKAETLVGICVERSVEMVVGLLAILKAGGAYVALDPNYPAARLAQILEDGELELVLTDSNSPFQLPETKTPVVDIKKANTVERQTNVVSNVNPQNLAYVLYTSGSTGRPKGVAIEHRSPVSLLHWAREVYSQEELSGVLASTSICFDLSVFELFVPLSWGGKVILAENALHLPELPAAGEVSLINTVPSAARELIRSQSIPSGVKTVNLAGEPLENQLVQKLYEQATIKAVYNLYGPSEDTTYSTYGLMEKGGRAAPTIGRPISNTQVYILDSKNQPVPIGVAGELHIGGEGLARGYLNKAELTTEKFIFWNGKRLYKTGDLARYQRNGQIQFLGRLDHQVKIRGYRIEIGEIQAILNEFPLVKETVVLAREDNSGNKGLVAYLVLESETPEVSETEQIDKVKQYLKEQLPEYMIPSRFVLLSKLPLTPNGKVDRKALPAPDLFSSLSTEYVAPETETQKTLAEIWQEVLGIEKVGTHDNFFELGGHSLLAIQVISRVRAAFSIELKLRDIFESPTVAGVAQAIDQGNNDTQVTNQVKDLRAEVILDSKIQNQSVAFKYISEPKNIFLTGATGFLGVYLLSELLEQTKGNIYCLVRATSSEQGKQRLQSSLESYSLWNESKSSRIIPVIGELSAPLLGLDEPQFNHLASQVDVIYHNGAWVNFVYSYSVLKPANVLGTQEVLRLASQTKIKPVHFISTISVFSSSGYSDKQVIFESDSLDYSPDNDDGYAESKWVAEKLVMEARDRRLPVCIYRPGRITGHSQTGFCNTEDLFSRMIKGCIQLGAVPNLEGVFSGIVPVDYVSKAIFNISQQKESLGKAFHMVNPNDIYVNEAFNMIRSWGYPIEQMDYEKWRTKLICQAENSNENALYPLLSLFSEELPVNAEKQRYDCTNTIHGLADTGLVCPSIDSKLLNTYYSYFRSSGLLNAPQ
ncbi:MAG: amino acid adenylation domain-containing protein, partial [Moorea sp. SIO4E2]|uniref:non-ribosomal peptide synthetase family protein n=1 Tax=Moorena sp. SIO4E2 TaxID=2607826 RepID=UPI0013B77056